MKIFNSIGHFFAWMVSTFIPAAEADITKFEGVLDSNIVAAIKTFTPAQVSNAVNAMLALAGDGMNVLVNAESALAAGGVNITMDTATLDAVKQFVADIKAAFAGGLAVPVAVPPSPQPIVKG